MKHIKSIFFSGDADVDVSSPKGNFNLLGEQEHSCMFSRFSLVQLFAALWTVAHQALLSMGEIGRAV